MVERNPIAGEGPVLQVPMMLDVPEMCRVVGHNLKCAREEAGLTQKELALVCFVPRHTVTRLEQGKQEAKLSTLALFSLAMRIPLTSPLLDGLDRLLLDQVPSDTQLTPRSDRLG